MIVQFRSRRNLINREWCMEEALDRVINGILFNEDIFSKFVHCFLF